jgi:F-type H+-transporting ATPase subunit gamma
VAGSGQIRQLKRRIKSVQSTQKITRAMEMIAASRIVKAQGRVRAARPYAEQIHDVIKGLAVSNEVRQHPLLQQRDITRVAVIVNTSDRGLAGAYNANVLKVAEKSLRDERAAGNEVELYVVGRKGAGYFAYRGERPERVWEGITDSPTVDAAIGIAETVMERFAAGDLDRVWLVYTDFKTSLTQTPVRMELLPVKPAEFRGGSEDQVAAQFLYEPSQEELLEMLIPRYVEAKVFHSLLESSASEHAARQRAMKSATDNAKEVSGNLSRIMNAARQEQITTEIMEIVGGAEALGSR